MRDSRMWPQPPGLGDPTIDGGIDRNGYILETIGCAKSYRISLLNR
jgi:hypothetical protein